MANNNLVLTVVLVAAALLLFNGGLSGQAVVSRSCTNPGSGMCIYNDLYTCGEDGRVRLVQNALPNQECFLMQPGGQTTAPTSAVLLYRQSGSSIPPSFSGPRLA